MERLKDLRERKWAWAVAGLVVGLAFGLLYAWGISPVEWKDASPALLSEPYRQDWMRMAIDSYAANRDADLALTRYQALGDLGAASLQGVAADPGSVGATAIQNFNAVISILEGAGTGTEVTAVPGAEPTPETKAGAAASKLVVPVCGATLLMGVLLAAALVLRNRMGSSRTPRSQSVVGAQADQESETPAPRGAHGSCKKPGSASARIHGDIPDDLYPQGRSAMTHSASERPATSSGNAGWASVTWWASASPRRSPPSRSGCSTRTTFRP
jgi:hypothetical protein